MDDKLVPGGKARPDESSSAKSDTEGASNGTPLEESQDGARFAEAHDETSQPKDCVPDAASVGAAASAETPQPPADDEADSGETQSGDTEHDAPAGKAQGKSKEYRDWGSSAKKFFSSTVGKVAVGIVAVVLVGGFLLGTHIICFHDWAEATCTEPATCTICGRTQGEPKGHDWTDATCTSPKTCKVCGETEGGPLGHDVAEWSVTKQASCSETGSKTGTCRRCGKEITDSVPTLDHTPGDWQITKDVSVTSSGAVIPGTQARFCTVCGKQVDSAEYTIDLSVSQKNALKKAASYLDYTSFSHSGLVHQLEFEGFSTEDAKFAADHCGADWNVQAEKKAKSYMEFTSFSRSGLIHQLEFEGFTAEQAKHGADSVGL